MTTISVRDAKNRFSALIEEVENTHDIVHITKRGKKSVVIMSEDELDAYRATIEWLSKPGILQTVQEAEEAIAEGNTMSLDELRAKLSRPPIEQS